MEPSCPSLIVQSDGHPVVPAALGNVILVEFANVAVFVSPCLWYCPLGTYSDMGLWLLC